MQKKAKNFPIFKMICSASEFECVPGKHTDKQNTEEHR